MVDRSEQHDSEDSDLVLDVPVLNVDELDLEVEDLRAHVSLRAELADLVKVNVGIDVYLDKVKLEIKGVEAQASLRVKLERVLNILERALASIDRNPQILGGTARNQDRTAEGGSRAASEEVPTTPRTADEPGGVTDAVPDESDSVVGEETTRGLADLQIEEEYVDDRGRIVGRARDAFGNVVEEVLDDKGDVLDPSVPEEEEADRGAEDEDAGEVDATDAARRKAGELGVDLSEVRGTGSNGRILAKDVERAARRSVA
jgi:pyruvate/2-oxoglutarate dehydrogenase complex dihydrolipoamide acyltransferase (E2) component